MTYEYLTAVSWNVMGVGFAWFMVWWACAWHYTRGGHASRSRAAMRIGAIGYVSGFFASAVVQLAAWAAR